MTARLLGLLVGVTLATTACREQTGTPPPSPPPLPTDRGNVGTAPAMDQVRQRGGAIVRQAFTLLSTNLAQAIQAGGISNALSYCSVKALPLTELVGDTNQVELRRVTHKPRNPANRASPAELEILASFRSALAEGETNLAPVISTNLEGGLTFYAPIVINNPLCLNCHGVSGEQILPDNVTLLSRLYPADEATGFAMGDLRGMWRVDFAPNAWSPRTAPP